MRPLLRLPTARSASVSGLGASLALHLGLLAVVLFGDSKPRWEDDEIRREALRFIAPENTSPPPSAAQLAANAAQGDDGSASTERESETGMARAGARAAEVADEGSAESAARQTANVLGVEARADRVFRVLEVDEQAMRDPNSGGPIYPEALQRRGIEGWVVARFVVDTSGYVVPGSLRVVSSTSSDFTRAVSDAMPTMLFQPAVRRGRKVKQETELTFRFRVARGQVWNVASP